MIGNLVSVNHFQSIHTILTHKTDLKKEYAAMGYLYSGPGESGGVMRPPHVRR
jgi:hypothetical protein